tara:strand:- start:143 stop:481 length:339 start_codon:yes stop_codon:yes gene_type:complete
MNASAQRISIKSLDMQRQSIMKSNRSTQKSTGASSAFRNVNLNSFGGKKQSFPEVVSYLSNPFQKNNLNFAVKNHQAIVTPKMAQGMRFTRAYKGVQTSVSSHNRAKSFGNK